MRVDKDLLDLFEHRLFKACHSILGDRIDYLFVNHWFKRGGSELETLWMMRVLKRKKPSIRIGLITTLPPDSEWLYKLPKDVVVLEFGKKAASMNYQSRKKVLLKLLLETAPAVIHNVSSGLCWDLYRDNGTQLSQRSVLFATAFSKEYPLNSKVSHDYVSTHLGQCRRHINYVFSDNNTHASEIRKEFGFNRIKPLYVPTAHDFKPPRVRKSQRPLRILWASRLDFQKSVEILYLVALFSIEHEFHVYGSYVVDGPGAHFDLKKLTGLENVRYHGEFDEITDIPLQSYDLFLYTSRWDGMPNILIEIASKGLPILAPDVGGIAELINDKTGFLVSSGSAVNEYLECIKFVQSNPEVAIERALEAQRLLKVRHNENRYSRDFGEVLQGFELL